MVLNNYSYEEQTRRLLSEAQSELSALDEEIAKLQGKRVIVAREVGAYETALQGYLRRIRKQEVAEVDWSKLLGTVGTHKERVKLIAEHNGGKVRVSQATDILYSKGFIRAKKRATAYSMVQVMLVDMAEDGIFEKIGPGEYRLVGAQQRLAGVTS